MDKLMHFFMIKYEAIIVPAIIMIVALLSGFTIRAFIFHRLKQWAQKTKTTIDDIIIDALYTPFILWCVIAGIYVALEFSSLPSHIIMITHKVVLVIGIVSVAAVLSHILSRLLTVLSGTMKIGLPGTSLTQHISRIVVFGLAILIILHALGIPITPLLATLGVGGLAVALALQDTLSNLFAGIYMMIARQIKIGDYIKLDSGEEGYVIDINWRTTEIRRLSNNMILIPNDKLIKTIVTNYYVPDKEMAVLVQVGVHYDSDLEQVEKITIEVGREIMKDVPGGIPAFEPFIRYHTFGDFSIGFTVILRVKEFVDQYMIKHEFIKRLHKKYAEKNIIIPYPIRTIYNMEK